MLCPKCEQSCSGKDIICANPSCSICCHTACLGISCDIFKAVNIFWFCDHCTNNLRSNKIIRDKVSTNTQEHTQRPVSVSKSGNTDRESICDITASVENTSALSTSIKELSNVVFSLGSQISSLSLRNLNLETKLDAIEFYSKRLEIEITGVPYSKQEDLPDIYQNICSLLRLPVGLNDITHITRVKPYDNSNTRKPIIIGFRNKSIRDQFLHSAKTCPNLTLINLGFDIPNYRFFINEHLTSLKKNILYKVKRLRNILKFRKLFVRDNKVFLILQNNQVLNVENNTVLESLIRSVNSGSN